LLSVLAEHRVAINATVLAVAFVAPAHAQQNDERVQDRYRLCMKKAEHDWLEEFRLDCDELCLRQQG
jgi:hypothetical protein